MPDKNPNEVPALPRLNDLFFAVCATAIKNCAWKYADFEKVKFVEGQLAALHAFFNEFYRQEEAAKPAEKQPANDAGVEIEIPKQTIAAAPEAAKPAAPVAPVSAEPIAEQEKKN